MTAREQVLRKHPSAFSAELCGWIYVIDTPGRMRRARTFLGSGKTRRAAWNRAAKT